jgi:hypothetical protein
VKLKRPSDPTTQFPIITSTASYRIRGSSREQDWSSAELRGFIDCAKLAIARSRTGLCAALYVSDVLDFVK